MKIFSQSAACALFAVANARTAYAPSAYDVPATSDCMPRAMSVPMPPVSSECVIRIDGENCDTWSVQLRGGWNRGWTLPVPEPTCIKPGDTTWGSCFMSHLPTRGKTDEKMQVINCSSTELTAFRNGHGPNGFLGFFVEVEWE